MCQMDTHISDRKYSLIMHLCIYVYTQVEYYAKCTAQRRPIAHFLLW